MTMPTVASWPPQNEIEREVSLCDLLDRVLNRGVVITGELVISVAGVELIYVGLNLIVSSVETLLEQMEQQANATE
jgi:gas vesicle structural protein